MTALDTTSAAHAASLDVPPPRTATLIRRTAPTRELYRCEPPLDGHSLVIASGVRNGFAHECYLFPADEAGNVTDWGELSGSIRGTVEAEDAFARAGYAIVREVSA